MTQQLKTILFGSGKSPFVRINDLVCVIFQLSHSYEAFAETLLMGSRHGKTLEICEEGCRRHGFQDTVPTPLAQRRGSSRIHIARPGIVAAALPQNHPDDIVRVGCVVAIAHLLRDLVIGLRDNLLKRDFPCVPQTSKRTNLGHGSPSYMTRPNSPFDLRPQKACN